MAQYPPFMNSTGLISKIFAKIKEAKTPDRFSQEFLANTLGFTGGSARPAIPLLKRLGFLASDGKPTELYREFRNPDHSKGAMARAIRQGYADLYARNEAAHELDRKALSGLVMQTTGLDKDAQTLRTIVASFEALKGFADFSSTQSAARPADQKHEPDEGAAERDKPPAEEATDLRLGLSYTVNLVLPRSDDVAVYNAIFRALREHLLRR